MSGLPAKAQRGSIAAAIERRRRGRGPLQNVEWILWGVPLSLCGLAGILIASTQRQADYADWYQHWITAAVGLGLALLLARLPLERLRNLQWPIYGLTILSLSLIHI